MHSSSAILLRGLTQYENRAAESLNEPAGHDAEHARVPVRSAENQRGGPQIHRLRFAALEDGLNDAGLNLLTLPIEYIQLLGQGLRAVYIISKEQLDDCFGSSHPAGGIDTRR